ncbi:MAG: ATP synthase F1 subunit gamma [Odoribacter sp.]
MATMRELKGRINSVHSSQKITGAMKMISSARLRKAENRLLQAIPYRQQLWNIYGHIEKSDCDYRSPLSEDRKVKGVAVVIYASEDGLCGAFNINLFKKLSETVRRYQASGIASITVYPIGRKIMHDVGRLPGVRIVEHTELFERKDYVQATRMLTDELTEGFLKGAYDRVEVVYATYKSIAVQTMNSRQFLPVIPETEEKSKDEVEEREAWYIYEPHCEGVLELLYPLMLHSLMYEMLLENQASEQGARIMAMQFANDNAMKLLGELQLEYNKLRQQGITTELLDIAGGKQ